MKIRDTLILISVTAVVFGGLLLGLLIFNNQKVLHNMERLTDVSYVGLINLQKMHTWGLQSEQSLRSIYLNPGDEKGRENLRKSDAAFLELANRTKALVSDGTGKRMDDLVKKWAEAGRAKERILQSITAGRQQEAAALIRQETALWRVIKDEIIDMSGQEEALFRKMAADTGKDSRYRTNLFIFVLAIYLIIICSLICYIFKMLLTALNGLRGNIESISGGNLCVSMDNRMNNEIGALATSLNAHSGNLHNIIGKVSGATTGLNSYASNISAAVEQQAATTSELSAAVTEITSTMEELSASSSQIAEHSRSVVDIATKTWDDTKKGALAVEAVIMKMGDINNDNQNSINEIVELGKKSKEISKIMEIINTIADQTKLIAFNAALEASSAGEAGKRFGVVAVEIRRLADSVMESTGEIEGKVNEIQEAINRLVIASEKGSKGIQEGMEYSNETATLLIDIVNAAQETTDAAKQISLSTQQQKTASNQVVHALREIVGGVGQTSNSINQIMSVSKDMVNLADDLKGLVDRFKLNDSMKKEGETQ